MQKLTKQQSRDMRSLMEDSGYSRREARELVLSGLIAVYPADPDPVAEWWARERVPDPIAPPPQLSEEIPF